MKTSALSEFDLYLFHQGTNYHAQEMLGAHFVEQDGKKGVRFTVWAPNAKAVSVVGEFNDWNVFIHPMSRIRRPLCATHTAKRMNRRPTATLIDPTTGAAVGVRTSATAAGARTASPKTAKTTTRSRPQPWAGRRRSSTPRTSGRSSTGAGISAALLSGRRPGRRWTGPGPYHRDRGHS